MFEEKISIFLKIIYESPFNSVFGPLLVYLPLAVVYFLQQNFLTSFPFAENARHIPSTIIPYKIRISVPRERQPDAVEGGLASSPLEAMQSNLSLGEKQEDADNQKNSTRASQAGLNSNTIHIPVTITAPPGETTIIPSKYGASVSF